MSHRAQHMPSLEMGRRVAAKLRTDHALIEFARANLTNRSILNAGSASFLACHRASERLLRLPLDSICRLLESTADESQRLRQNTPLAGAISPLEVWQIKRRVRRDQFRD